MRYASKPTVSAVAGLAIGGGFEVACQTSRMVAHMNSTLGLVETGVGLFQAVEVVRSCSGAGLLTLTLQVNLMKRPLKFLILSVMA